MQKGFTVSNQIQINQCCDNSCLRVFLSKELALPSVGASFVESWQRRRRLCPRLFQSGRQRLVGECFTAAAQLPPTPPTHARSPPATPQPPGVAKVGPGGHRAWKTSHASLTSCTKQRRVGSLGGRLDVVWVSRDGCQGQNLPGLSWLLIRETSSSLGFCLQQLASLCFPERPFRCLNLPRLL